METLLTVVQVINTHMHAHIHTSHATPYQIALPVPFHRHIMSSWKPETDGGREGQRKSQCERKGRHDSTAMKVLEKLLFIEILSQLVI